MSESDNEKDQEIADQPKTSQESDSSPKSSPSTRKSDARPSKRRMLRAVLAIVIGFLVIGSLQWIAPDFDHQIANMISIVLGMVVAIYVAWQAHQASRVSGHSYRVPIALVTIIGGFFVLFEPDGFSGEMIPQFRYRFGAKPELKDVADASDAASSDEEAIALADSPGFLGNNRNAVISKRLFAVPKSDDEVKVLWDIGIGKGWASFAVANDRAVTLEQRDDLECVTCYRLSDGELLWMHSYEASHYHPLGGAGPRSTPFIKGDRVYAQGATGHLACLNLQSGKPFWIVDLLQIADWSEENFMASVSWGYATSPLIVGDMCVVSFGGEVDVTQPEKGQRSLIALDAESGDVRWKSGHDQISYASPMLMTLAGEPQIVSVNEKTITGHRVDDGEILWTFDWPGSSNSNATCTSALPAGDNRFLIGKGYSGGSALVEVTKDPQGKFQADYVWTSLRVLKTKFTHSCIDLKRDIVYALSDGSLQAVRLSDGHRLWMQPRSARFGQGQTLLADDIIIAQAEAGDVVFVSATLSEYTELMRIPALSSKTWNIPTLAGRHLLVRNDRQAICYLLPARD